MYSDLQNFLCVKMATSDYMPLGKVKEEERRFDFKEKKLKSAVEKIINISDLLSEDDLINPLKNDSWWNVYGE